MPISKMPAWVVERCDDVKNAAIEDNRTGKRDLSSEEITDEVLAEFLAILEERAGAPLLIYTRKGDLPGPVVTLAKLLESPNAG